MCFISYAESKIEEKVGIYQHPLLCLSVRMVVLWVCPPSIMRCAFVVVITSYRRAVIFWFFALIVQQFEQYHLYI